MLYYMNVETNARTKGRKMDDQQRELVEYDFSCAASTYNDCLSEAVETLQRVANIVDHLTMPLIDDETSKGSAHIAQLYTRSIVQIQQLQLDTMRAMGALVDQTIVV